MKTVLLVIIEGLALALWLWLICKYALKKGSAWMVSFYEPEVKERVIQLGMATEKEIRKASLIVSAALFLPILFIAPIVINSLNGAVGFKETFIQMLCIYTIMNLFDRLYIDWYWVGHTKDWDIKGTEDLKPYIPKRTLIKKWFGTLVAFPLLVAVMAWIMQIVK